MASRPWCQGPPLLPLSLISIAKILPLFVILLRENFALLPLDWSSFFFLEISETGYQGDGQHEEP